MSIVTRFAPSPTGFLHIGGARTALYNWLYARHAQGKFLLRIEDTDRKRSTPEAVRAILDGMAWLGLNADEEPVYQFSRRARHAEVAHLLVAAGKAYRCYCSPGELADMRARARSEKRAPGYDGTWRDRDPDTAPGGIDPVIRLKCARDGVGVIRDAVQGEVTVANAQLDDYVILRADGTPTYMLSVVVDDHDMGVTHVIRGDDHLTNAFRQKQLYEAMGWEVPVFAHIPLIHGADGAKLSKRHGALGIDAYRDEMGFLPEALKNYLLRLGWGHGDEEIISEARAIDLFDIGDVGKAAARFDPVRLTSLNGHYLRMADDARLVSLIAPRIAAALGRDGLDRTRSDRLAAGMAGLKERAKDLIELARSATFYARSVPLPMTEKAAGLLNGDSREILRDLAGRLQRSDGWGAEEIEEIVRALAHDRALKLGKVAQPLRAALSGSHTSPGIFEVMTVLGRDETLARLAAVDG